MTVLSEPVEDTAHAGNQGRVRTTTQPDRRTLGRVPCTSNTAGSGAVAVRGRMADGAGPASALWPVMESVALRPVMESIRARSSSTQASSICPKRCLSDAPWVDALRKGGTACCCDAGAVTSSSR